MDKKCPCDLPVINGKRACHGMFDNRVYFLEFLICISCDRWLDNKEKKLNKSK